MGLKLPLLPAAPLFDQNGVPTSTMQQYWQQFAEAIQDNINSILAAQEAAAAAQTAADNANTAATNAQTAADTAQAAATASTQATSLQGSYPDPANILTAQDDGTDTEVDIAAHNRVYSDGTTVAVDAGSVTGLPYSILYYIYYEDPSREGGAVTYLATTDSATAAQTGDTHTVGSVTTPAALAPPVTGKGVRPPGVGAIP